MIPQAPDKDTEEKKEIEQIISEPQIYKIITKFITQYKALDKPDGFTVKKSECSWFIWLILTKMLHCEKIEREEDEVFVSERNIEHLTKLQFDFIKERLCGAPPGTETEEETKKKKRKRKGILAHRIIDLFFKLKEEWFDIAQTAKQLKISPYSSPLLRNLKKLARLGFLLQKKTKGKLYFKINSPYHTLITRSLKKLVREGYIMQKEVNGKLLYKRK